MEDGSAQTDIELYLLRHAHAGNPAEWTGDDAKRPLSKKGRRQAEMLGQFMAQRGFAPDSIVTSSKLRARQTSEIFADALGLAFTVDDRLAGSFDVDTVDAIVEAAGGTSIVLVGHDPDFSDIAAELIGAAYLPLKKASIARIDAALPIQHGSGILRWLLAPDLLIEQT